MKTANDNINTSGLTDEELAALQAAEEAEQETDEGEEGILGFSLDDELEGVQKRAGYEDPVPGNHIFYVRPIFGKSSRKTADGGLIAGPRITYEILATESEAAEHIVGGLLTEFFVFVGDVPEYEKYSAGKQVADAKANFLSRLAAFKPEANTAEGAVAEYAARYQPDASSYCARVKITAKTKGEYTNITRVRVLDAKVAIADVLKEAAAGWTYFEPFEG